MSSKAQAEELLGKHLLKKIVTNRPVTENEYFSRALDYNSVHSDLIKVDDLKQIAELVQAWDSSYKESIIDQPIQSLYALDKLKLLALRTQYQLNQFMKIADENQLKGLKIRSLLSLVNRIVYKIDESYLTSAYTKLSKRLQDILDQLPTIAKTIDAYKPKIPIQKLQQQVAQALIERKAEVEAAGEEPDDFNVDNVVYDALTHLFYEHVITWKDMIETNVLFLQGKLPGTYGHPGYFGAGSGFTHTEAGKKLVKLNQKYGVFTVDGQSNDCDQDTNQRSYITSFIDVKLLQKVLPSLLEDPDIQISVAWPDLIRYYDNYDDNELRHNVTFFFQDDGELDYYTNMLREPIGMYMHSHPLEVFMIDKQYDRDKQTDVNVSQLFIDKAKLSVVKKDYCGATSAEEVLMKHLDKVWGK